MPKVDMSAKAVTTRLKRTSQLRKLSLSLQKAKLVEDQTPEKREESSNPTLPSKASKNR